MNATHQIFTYADDVNLIGDDIGIIERNANVLLNDSKDIGLAVIMEGKKEPTWN